MSQCKAKKSKHYEKHLNILHYFFNLYYLQATTFSPTILSNVIHSDIVLFSHINFCVTQLFFCWIKVKMLEISFIKINKNSRQYNKYHHDCTILHCINGNFCLKMCYAQKNNPPIVSNVAFCIIFYLYY